MVTHPTLTTRLCELVGIEYPIVQTGMGWVAGPRLAAATSSAGGLGILAASTMDFEQLRTAIADVKQRTDKPFGVNIRSDAPDAPARIDLLIEQGVRVASFALAPRQEQIARLKDAGVVVMPSIGAKRHAEKVAEWGVDAIMSDNASAAARPFSSDLRPITPRRGSDRACDNTTPMPGPTKGARPVRSE